MHELSITRNIVAIACEHAGARKVRAVHLRVGALSGIDVRAVRYCYDLCTDGTVAAGSRLEVEEVAGRARCTGCAEDIPLDSPVALCPCERRAPLERIAGDELLVTSMEVDDV
jgi:hydrogenase nickel incorporation protein HypA/HybF